MNIQHNNKLCNIAQVVQISCLSHGDYMTSSVPFNIQKLLTEQVAKESIF